MAMIAATVIGLGVPMYRMLKKIPILAVPSLASI